MEECTILSILSIENRQKFQSESEEEKRMKRRWIALAAALMMVLGLFGAFPAFAAEETITVPVSVTGVFEGENHWADATYTCVATDGVPAGSGILSNGKYSFMYFPQIYIILSPSTTSPFSSTARQRSASPS